jgi:hypothetical protein
MTEANKHTMQDSDKLTGINYLTWAFVMQMILVHADLWDITSAPPDDMTPAKMKQSQKALALIVFNLSTSLIPIVRVCETASEAWSKLESLYAQKSQHRIQMLRDQLAALTLGSSESVSAYFARARGLWNELLSLGHSTTELDVVWSILKGLPSRFKVIVTILRSSDSLTLDSAMSQIMAFDQSPTCSSGSGDGSVTAHAATTKPTCNYCKKPGHFIRECRQRIAAEARRAENPAPETAQGNIASTSTGSSSRRPVYEIGF